MGHSWVGETLKELSVVRAWQGCVSGQTLWVDGQGLFILTVQATVCVGCGRATAIAAFTGRSFPTLLQAFAVGNLTMVVVAVQSAPTTLGFIYTLDALLSKLP